MKERPIIFATAMVRAIRRTDYTQKTQSRRVIDPQPEYVRKLDQRIYPLGDYEPFTQRRLIANLIKECPYGVAGDRLWVREALRLDDNNQWRYEADEAPVMCAAKDEAAMVAWAIHKERPYSSPRFMPKWAARTWLDLTEVRVEQLQNISAPDALAEGCGILFCNPCDETGEINGEPCEECAGEGKIGEVSHFRRVWDEINAKRGWGWAQNPWVWVLVFRRIDHG